MCMKILSIILFFSLLPIASIAGSRGLDIAFLDATPSNTTNEGKRLAELLVIDMKKLYAGDQIGKLFPWSENEIEIKVFNPSSVGISFDRLLNTKGSKKIKSFLQKYRVQDGLIVFF